MAIPHLLDDNHQMFCRVERIDVRVQIVKWNYAELVARSQRRESLAVRNSTPANTKTSVEQPCEINVSDAEINNMVWTSVCHVCMQIFPLTHESAYRCPHLGGRSLGRRS
jgi:hypothetical protein